jgi:hypothetical protein
MLMYTSEHTSVRDSSSRISYPIFFDIISGVTVVKPLHEMHIGIIFVGKLHVHSYCSLHETTALFAIWSKTLFASATHQQLLTPGYLKQKFPNMTPHARLRPADTYSACNLKISKLSSCHYLRNRSTLDMGVRGCIGIFYPEVVT